MQVSGAQRAWSASIIELTESSSSRGHKANPGRRQASSATPAIGNPAEVSRMVTANSRSLTLLPGAFSV